MLLLNPPSSSDALANREGTASFGTLSTGFLYPPHTLATIIAACRQADLNVTVLDAVAEKLDLPDCIERIRSAVPPLLGVYCSWGTINADRENIHALRTAFPRLPIIALGASVRFCCEELLVSGASHVLLGDPELAFAELAGNPLPPPGIVRVRSLLPDQHNASGLLLDPADLPRPAWNAVPWQKYGFLTVFGSRGCEDRCKFCAYIVAQGRSYRPRPVEDVIAEMVFLEETFQPKRIIMRDPVFAQERVRAMAIAKGLIQRGFSTPWECESRPEHFDDTLLKTMSQAGCTVIKLGVESADPDLLTQIGRIDNPKEAAHYLAYTRHIVDIARRNNIRTRVFVMAGLPGQTVEHAEATAAYLNELNPTFIHARPYVAYPRAPLGRAQSPAQTEQLLAPLQAVADAQQAAQRPSLLSRIRHCFL